MAEPGKHGKMLILAFSDSKKAETGGIKEAAGKATGNKQLENEGKADKAEGRVRSAVGHAKDAVRELVGGKR